jgi:hypothetical protein
MDGKIIWTERSSSDIEAIVRYIARRDPAAASRIGIGLYERALIGQFNSVINLPSSYTLLYGSSELDLVPLSAVPEPGTWAAGGLAFAALVCTQLRKHSRAPSPKL